MFNKLLTYPVINSLNSDNLVSTGCSQNKSKKLEVFDKTVQAKEKGRISVNIRDKTVHFWQNFAQPFWDHQN